MYRETQVVYNDQRLELLNDGSKDSGAEVGARHRWAGIQGRGLVVKKVGDDTGGWMSQESLETL